ncbi:M4 family metallopeptidase [Micromonospora narathiwatensis]|uniref:Zn-dependent metalloprotease n=1 Tax=Micromonospora narathiwatensis TaxID=299146 RepID=A0A1A9A894_9ACTN|nr:M4 family metallopeptidase [Micromonospora narathiwatensis]SBT52326.1 Zn-dependent metalloprotease [Micromonospora narathiwatensis]
MKRPLAAVSAALLTSGVLTCVTTTAYAATPSAPAAESAVARADSILRTNPGAVQGASGEAYQAVRTKVDASGATHTRYTRTYHGLRVYGGDFVVHAAPNGAVAGTSVGLTAPLTLSTTAKVGSAAAQASARKTFSGTLTSVGASELFVDASSGQGRLAWETVASGWKADRQTPSKLHVITDASTGKVIGSYDEIESVAGTGNSVYSGTVSIDTTLSGSTYSMVDPSHGNGRTCDMNNTTTGTCATFTNSTNTWGNGATSNRQSAAVDAHFGAAVTFDYFKNVHGRNGIFGNGAGVPSRVHYGNNYVNAFWDGSQMTYGDGSSNSRPLVSLDVAGHEMSHGVTEAVAGLVYSGESGGLNEATSDIFGTMVEFYANAPSDPGDYDIGEKININGNGKPLRYMYNPSLDGSSHSCWSTTTKNVDVHYSSGPGNHFFFNLAEGTGATAYGTSPVCGSAPAVTGIGRAKAEKIWYRALDVYFTSNTTYVNTSNPANTARAYTLKAATDLYGNCSTEYKAVQAAWTAVSVTGNDAPCGSTGNDFSVSLSPTSGSVTAGSAVSTTVSTATTSGTAQTVTFSASGLPTGASASFSPASVTSGASSTLTISTSASTPSGTYPVTITGTATSGAKTTTYTLTVNGTGGGCTGAGQKLGNPGFESGNTVWTATTGVIGQYGSSGQPTHGGTWNAWMDGYGSTHTDTLSQSVSLPTGCTTYNFSFWLHIDSSETTTTTAYDKLTVQVLNSSGTVLTTLATYSNLNKATGYSQKTFSLAAYAGQNVTLKFTATEDVLYQTSFVIDDTAVNVS